MGRCVIVRKAMEQFDFPTAGTNDASFIAIDSIKIS
jgi:hypothetical protein